MNRQIDEKVVRMSLENGQFESAIDKSIASIEKLEKKLEFKDAGDGFNDIQKSANKVDLSHIEKALDSLNDKFTLLGMTGVKMLDKISTKAIDVGMKMAKSLTIKAPLDGLNEYELKLNSIQTILANTRSKGTQLSDVTEALDELNTYADKTVYVFSDMTRAIGQFTTAGVDLKSSVAAIKGMSNLAATVGADNATLSRANYQVSQALNTGYFRLMDWKSLENAAGMGGEMMQEALKQTAREYGVAIDSIIAKNGSFRESLRDNWLTAEIYLKTMEKFSDPTRYPEYQFMEDAATKVRTFKKLVETTMESIGSQWAGIWERIIGNFDEATALWSGINKIINSNNSPLISALNTLQNVLDHWRAKGGRDNLIKGLVQLLGALWTYVRPIAYALVDTFRLTSTGLANATKSFADFTAKLQLGEEGAKGLYNIFRSIFLVIKTIIKVHNAIWAAMSPLIDLFNYVLDKVLGITGEVGDNIDKLSHDIDILIKIGQILIHDVLEKAVSILIEAFENVDFDDLKDVIIDIAKVLGAAFVLIAETIKLVLPFIVKLVKALPNIGRYLKTIFVSLASTGKIVTEYMRDRISTIFKMISNLDIRSLFNRFVTAGYAVIQGIVTGLISGVHAIVETIQNIGWIMLEAFKQTLGIASPSKVFYEETSWVTAGIVGSITDGTAKAVVATKNMAGAMANGYAEEVNSGSLSDIILGPASIFEKLLAILLYLGDKIKWAMSNIGNIFKWTLESIVNIIKKLLDVINKLFRIVKEQFKTLVEYITETWGIEWDEIFRITILSGIVISLVAVVRAIIKIGTMASMLVKTFATMSKTLKIFTRSFTGQFSPVTNFIFALGLIVSSFVALLLTIEKGGIKKDTLIWASSIMGGIVAVIITMIILVGAMQSKGIVLNKGQKLVASTKGMIIGFTVILGVIVYLVKILSTIKTHKLKAISSVLTSIMGILVSVEGMAILVGKLGTVERTFKQTMLLIGSVTALAIALSSSMYILSKVDYTQLDQGRTWIASIIGIVIGIMAAVWLLSRTKFANDGSMKPLFGISSLIISIGLLFTAIAAAFVILGEVDWDNVTEGWPYLLVAGVILAAVIAATILIFKIANKNNFNASGNSDVILGSLGGMAAIITSIGVQFIALALAFKILSYVDWNGISDGAVYIGIAALMITAVTVAIAAMVASLNKNKDASFVGKDADVEQKSNVSEALAGMAKVISKIGMMFISLAIAFRILDNVDWTKINDGLWYLIGTTATLLLIIGALYQIEKLSSESETGGTSPIQGVGETIRALSKLIVSLAAFFILCWLINWRKVKQGWPLLLGAVGFIIALMGMFVAMAAVGKGNDVIIKNMGGMLLGIMGVVLSIGLLFILLSDNLVDAKKISRMNKSLWAIAAVIIALGAVLLGLGALASKDGNKVTSTVLIFMTMLSLVFASMAVLMFALGQAQVTPRQLQGVFNIIKIIMAVSGIIAIVAGLVGLSDRVSKNASAVMMAISAMMISLFAGVALMTLAANEVDVYGLDKLTSALTNILAIVAILVTVVAVINSLDRTGISGGISIAIFASIALVFLSVSVAILAMGAAVNAVAEAMERVEKLNPERLSKNIESVSKGITKLRKAVLGQDGSTAGLAGALWAVCIPALILSVAFFNIALGISLVLGVVGLLALAVLGLALAFSALTGTSLDDLADKLIEALESEKLHTVAEKIGEIIADVISGVLIGFYNKLKDWADQFLEDVWGDAEDFGVAWQGLVDSKVYEKAGEVGPQYTSKDLEEIAAIIKHMEEDPNSDSRTKDAWKTMFYLLNNGYEDSATLAQGELAKGIFAGNYSEMLDHVDKQLEKFPVDDLKDSASVTIRAAEKVEDVMPSVEELAKYVKTEIGPVGQLNSSADKLATANRNFRESLFGHKDISKSSDQKALNKLRNRWIQEYTNNGSLGPSTNKSFKEYVKQENLGLYNLFFNSKGLSNMKNFKGFANIYDTFKKYGISIPEGVDAGIKEAQPTVYDTMEKLGIKLPEIFRIEIDSHSPSKVFYDIGLDIVNGLANGIDDGASIAEQSMLGISSVLQNAASKFTMATEKSINGIATNTTGFASVGVGYQGNMGFSVLDGYQASIAANAETKTETKTTKKESDKEGFLGINWNDVGSWFMDKLSTLGDYGMQFWNWLKEKFGNGIDWLKEKLRDNFPDTYDVIMKLAYSLGIYTAVAGDWTKAWSDAGVLAANTSWGGASHAAIELEKNAKRDDITKDKNYYNPWASRDFSLLDYTNAFNDLLNFGKENGAFDTGVTTPDMSNLANDNMKDMKDSSLGLSDTSSEDTQRIQDIIFNQYNYSPEELDRTEIYKQTKAQINAFKEYMQYY